VLPYVWGAGGVGGDGLPGGEGGFEDALGECYAEALSWSLQTASSARAV
jgi:hypothetical protein